MSNIKESIMSEFKPFIEEVVKLGAALAVARTTLKEIVKMTGEGTTLHAIEAKAEKNLATIEDILSAGLGS